jgi:hypothetical protein
MKSGYHQPIKGGFLLTVFCERQNQNQSQRHLSRNGKQKTANKKQAFQDQAELPRQP